MHTLFFTFLQLRSHLRFSLITSLVALITLVLSACSPAKSLPPDLQAPPALDETGGTSGNFTGERNAGVEAPAAEIAQDSTSVAGSGAGRLVIKNANLTIVVDDPGKSIDSISAIAEEMQGYVVSADLYQARLANDQEAPRGSITIRVPSSRMDEALERIKSQSNRPVENVNINSQDVTKEYTDLQSRLRNLEAAEVQLLKIMDSATKTEDVLNVFSQLTQVREQIEVTKGQIQYYEQSAALSAISVELLPNEAVQPLTIGAWQASGVAKQAIQALIDALKVMATAAIWLVLLVLPVLLVVFLPLYLLLRLLRSWRASQRAKARVSSPPAA